MVYSHKTHEKCADILLLTLGRIKLAQILLSAVTTGGFIAAIVTVNELAALLGAVVSTALLVLNAYTKDYDLGELAQKHRQAAGDLWLIREQYLSLLADLRSDPVNLDKVRQRRDELLMELRGAYSGAPSTTFKAYRQAQRALTEREDLTFSSEEIDAFLPDELKRA